MDKETPECCGSKMYPCGGMLDEDTRFFRCDKCGTETWVHDLLKVPLPPAPAGEKSFEYIVPRN